MRDRLIELLKKADKYASGVCTDYDEAQEVCAEYLLAEGVIVPKVKIGDKLYELSASKTKLYEITVTHLEVHENDIRIWGKKTQWQEVKWICSQEDLENNEWVYLTREEAEAALERSENGKS